MSEDDFEEFVTFYDSIRRCTRFITSYKDGGSSETIDGQVRLYHPHRHYEPERMTLVEQNRGLETRTNFKKEECFEIEPGRVDKVMRWVEEQSLDYFNDSPRKINY